jgi:predicted nucleotidyltransferase component of viral defense system
MKEHLATLVRDSRNQIAARNQVREYLQARILGSLQRSGAMIPLAFHGGTALRFLYSLPRSSEDLDFALERPSKLYDLQAYLSDIRRLFEAEGYRIRIRASDRKTVHTAFVQFPGLLYELNLSGQSDEALAIKLEVDSQPPEGSVLMTSVVRRHVTLRLQHHDRASLLAGKLHAILQRPFKKGRDAYDLLWYLSDPAWPEPNLILLNNALVQTGWSRATITDSNWRGMLKERLQGTNFEALRQDVLPFLEHPEEIDLLTWEDLNQVLG